MSVIMEGIVNFNLTTDNPFWLQLQEANKFHVSARDRYSDLLDLCKSKGVKFKDIKAHLLNEAKKCGLYTRSMWSDTQKTMVYRTWSDLLQCRYSWVICLNNFMSWVSNNWKDYGIRKDRIAYKHKPSVQKATVVRRVTGADGAVSEVKTETVSTVETVAATQDTVDTVAPGGIVAPVTQQLSELQVQTLILQNLQVLGKICLEKGAIKEFNALMFALQAMEFVVE